MTIGSGIAIAGIWIGTAVALAMGTNPGIIMGSTIATAFVAMCND